MPTYTLNFSNWSGTSWKSQSNAQYVDGVVSNTNAIITSGTTSALTGTGPSAISPGANETLYQIVATVTRSASVDSVNTYVEDNSLVLVVGGTPTSMNKGATGVQWPTSLSPATYTWSKTDLASLGITLATVQNANFGVSLTANVYVANLYSNVANVDAIVLTVTTTAVSLPGSMLVQPPFSVRTA